MCDCARCRSSNRLVVLSVVQYIHVTANTLHRFHVNKDGDSLDPQKRESLPETVLTCDPVLKKYIL